ncbi:MAG: leucyl/phenylalanyl-tRNA--protein transferase [Planctomycetota bacterium]
MPGEADPTSAGLVEAVLGLYARGLFPMADTEGVSPGETAPIGVYRPERRGLFRLEEGGLRVTRSLRQRVRSGRFRVTADRAFDETVAACSREEAEASSPEDGVWIDPQMRTIYRELHRRGNAHSVEAWLARPGGDETLVGGLFCVTLGGLCAGESMFSRPDLGGTDASKVCLVHLWHHLRVHGYGVLDCQFATEHLASLGAIEIEQERYEIELPGVLARGGAWGEFDPDLAGSAIT